MEQNKNQTLENIVADDLTAGAALSAFAEKAAQQTSLPAESEETIMEGNSLIATRKSGNKPNQSNTTLPLEGEETIQVEDNVPKKLVKRRGRPPKSQSSHLISEDVEQMDSFEPENVVLDEGKKEEVAEENIPKRKRGRLLQPSPLTGEDEKRVESFEMDQLDVSVEAETEEKKKGIRSKIVRWTPKEDELLLKIVPATVINEDNPFFWRSIAKQIPGKTINQCFQHWNRVLNPKIRKGPWGPEEEAELVSYAEKLRGDVRHLWSRVAAMTQGRIDTQCRYQMRIIEKSGAIPWEKTEDTFLIAIVQSEDRDQTSRDWIKVAHKFNNKMARASSRKTPIRCSLHVRMRCEYLTGVSSEIGVSNEAAGTSILPAVDSVMGSPTPDHKNITSASLPTPTYRGPVPSKIAHGSYPYSISGGSISSAGHVGRHMSKSTLGQNVVQVAADAIGLRDSSYNQYENNSAQQAYEEPPSFLPDQSQAASRYNPNYSQELSYEQQYDVQQTSQVQQEDIPPSNQQSYHQNYTSEQQQSGEYNNSQEYDVNNGQGQIYNQSYNEEEYPPQ